MCPICDEKCDYTTLTDSCSFTKVRYRGFSNLTRTLFLVENRINLTSNINACLKFRKIDFLLILSVELELEQYFRKKLIKINMLDNNLVDQGGMEMAAHVRAELLAQIYTEFCLALSQ